jgi:hypothetical protein
LDRFADVVPIADLSTPSSTMPSTTSDAIDDVWIGFW